MLLLKRYLLYLKNKNFKPSSAFTILQLVRSNIPDSSNIIIRDVRIAHRFLEFDVSVSEQKQLDRNLINAFSEIADFDSYELIRDEDFSKNEAIERARDLFNNEKFWRCHEVLENIWKQTDGEEKNTLNGIILVAAALVHFQKGENETCLGILRRAHEKIKLAKSEYYGINIDLLDENLRKIIESGKITLPRL